MEIIFRSDVVVLIGKPENQIPHKHYAIQAVFSCIPLIVNGKKYHNSVLINSNALHMIDSDNPCICVMVDPNSSFGKNLSIYLDGGSVVNFDIFIEKYPNLLGQKVKDLDYDGILNGLFDTFNRIYTCDYRTTQAIQFIESNLENDITIEQIADIVHLSHSRLSHLFKSEVGISIMRYIRWTRLVRAAQYIIENKTTISTGAYKYRFSDDAHFARNFKTAFGINFKHVLLHSFEK